MLAKTRAAKDAAEAERAKYGNDDPKRPNRKDRGITPEVLRTPTDVREDPKYQGQTTFMIKYIPVKCVDERTMVDKATLREWILCAVVEEDPYSKRFFQEIHRIQAMIAEIDGHLRQIPRLNFLDEDGQPMSDEKSRIEREIIFNKYSEDRAAAEELLFEAQRQLQSHIDWRRTMGIEFLQGEVDRNTDTCTWYMSMSGTNDVQEIEDLLIRKQNWPGIKLASGSTKVTPHLLPWAGRGEFPDGSKANQPDYSSLQVNIAGARFMRVPSGIGLLQSLDRSSSSIYGDDFGFFYGEFDSGLKHGYGIDISDEGVYAGTHEKGFRRNHGRIDYADGTTIIGNFGVTAQRNTLETSGFKNPYMEGEASGLVEINFSDGGFYRGNMVNGRISGQGDYQSAFNEVMSGNFNYGALHCDKGFLQNQSGDTYIGTFRQGEMHGKGTYLSNRRDSYDGYWEHFMRHGRGVSRTGDTGEYRGYFINNLKHGKGSIAYGNASSKAARKKFKHDQRAKQAAAEQREKEEKDEKAKSSNGGTESSTTNSKSEEKKATTLKSNNSGNNKVQSESESRNDTTEEHQHKPLSDFDNIFQGYFIGNSLCNSGCIMDTTVQVPSIISRLNRRSCYPIFREINKDLRHAKQSNRLQEKFDDMEHHVRSEIAQKKIKIFKQQRHYTKKTMYAEDTIGGIEYNELKSKLFLRQERLKNMKTENYAFKKALVPRLRLMNNRPFDAMSKTYERLRPDQTELKELDRVNDELVKIAISDFEEVQERQRFLKYDLIWQRAEDAFADAHKSAAERD